MDDAALADRRQTVHAVTGHAGADADGSMKAAGVRRRTTRTDFVAGDGLRERKQMVTKKSSTHNEGDTMGGDPHQRRTAWTHPQQRKDPCTSGRKKKGSTRPPPRGHPREQQRWILPWGSAQEGRVVDGSKPRSLVPVTIIP